MARQDGPVHAELRPWRWLPVARPGFSHPRPPMQRKHQSPGSLCGTMLKHIRERDPPRAGPRQARPPRASRAEIPITL